MELARNIPGSISAFPLAVAGYKMNDRVISRLKSLGIQGVYIRTELTEGIEPRDIVDPELKVKILSDIRRAYDHGFSSPIHQVRNNAYEEMNTAAKAVVMNILENDQYLFQMIDIRDYDNYTYSHSLYVGILSVLLGRYLQFDIPKLQELALCGLLHDIGKTDIPIEITNKNGPLTDEEFEIMKQHPALSYKKAAEQGNIPQTVLQGIQTHHEKYDGSGYLSGLHGKDIPLYGRILAITDNYDALNSNRPYRKAWPARKVFDFLTSCSNSHFDPDLLTAFFHCVCAYPVGTVVHLSDGSTAVVKDNTPGFSLRPIIRFITPASKAGKEVDLSHTSLNVTIIDDERLE